MRIRDAAWPMIVAGLLGAGCGAGSNESPTENPFAEEFRAASGLTFDECGDVVDRICSSETCDACSTAETEMYGCIMAAFDSCTPAHYRERLRYQSWSEDVVDVFVLPGTGGCRVVQFRHSLEPRCESVVRSDCTHLEYEGDPPYCELYAMDCQVTWLDGESDSCGE